MNSRFRPYRIILSRQGGSINIIQVTVYFFTVPALKLMNVKFCLFLATTAHCHDRAAIKIHITTFNCINLQVRCGNLHNFNCFWLSYIYIYIAAFLNGVILQKKQRGSNHCSCPTILTNSFCFGGKYHHKFLSSYLSYLVTLSSIKLRKCEISTLNNLETFY